MLVTVTQTAVSCNKNLTKNEKQEIRLKQSKLKKNRMQSKNDVIQFGMACMIDANNKKAMRRERANNRRANSK